MNDDSKTTAVESVREPQATALEQATGQSAFDQLWKEASVWSHSSLVPKEHQGKTENCFIILGIARANGIPDAHAMAKIGVINGKPTLPVELQSVLIKRAGVFKAPVRVELKGTGKDMSAQAFGVLTETGEEVAGELITMEMARRDGWTKNSKYESMPGWMLKNRAKAFFYREHCPEVLLGMSDPDEAADAHYSETGPRYVSEETDDLERRLTAGSQGKDSRVVDVVASQSESAEEVQVEENVSDWDI